MNELEPLEKEKTKHKIFYPAILYEIVDTIGIPFENLKDEFQREQAIWMIRSIRNKKIRDKLLLAVEILSNAVQHVPTTPDDACGELKGYKCGTTVGMTDRAEKQKRVFEGIGLYVIADSAIFTGLKYLADVFSSLRNFDKGLIRAMKQLKSAESERISEMHGTMQHVYEKRLSESVGYADNSTTRWFNQRKREYKYQVKIHQRKYERAEWKPEAPSSLDVPDDLLNQTTDFVPIPTNVKEALKEVSSD
jgi:hypothetical protein